MLHCSVTLSLRLLAVASLGVMLLIAPGPALAHFGSEAFILVPGEQVSPGEPFEVVVADLSPGAAVTLVAVRNGQTVEVGRTVSDREGHFTTSATLPADYPHGYAELVATAQDGTQVATWVHVGPRTGGTGAPPSSPSGGGGIDPSLVVLGLMVAGAIAAAGYLVLRRRPAVAHAPGTSGSADRRARRVARKRR